MKSNPTWMHAHSRFSVLADFSPYESLVLALDRLCGGQGDWCGMIGFSITKMPNQWKTYPTITLSLPHHHHTHTITTTAFHISRSWVPIFSLIINLFVFGACFSAGLGFVIPIILILRPRVSDTLHLDHLPELASRLRINRFI
jgi:hypothetical protein